MQNSSFEVRSIGEAALGFLTSTRCGRVLAVVTQAAYLLSEQNELIWLTTAPAPLHRRCLRLSAALPPLTAGCEYEVLDHRLRLDRGAVLDLQRASVWSAAALASHPPAAAVRLPEALQAFFSQFLARYAPRGWGGLIPALLESACQGAAIAQQVEGDPLPAVVRPAVAGILQACQASDFAAAEQHAAPLVGLGEGLTPSGDDFLGGFFFALRLLQQACPEAWEHTTWNYSDFIQSCKPLTNVISFTLLKDHGEGHTLEPLHRFAAGLLAGGPAERLLPPASELIGVGHSTGWDLLTGFLAGMSVLCPILTPDRHVL